MPYHRTTSPSVGGLRLRASDSDTRPPQGGLAARTDDGAYLHHPYDKGRSQVRTRY